MVPNATNPSKRTYAATGAAAAVVGGLCMAPAYLVQAVAANPMSDLPLFV